MTVSAGRVTEAQQRALALHSNALMNDKGWGRIMYSAEEVRNKVLVQIMGPLLDGIVTVTKSSSSGDSGVNGAVAPIKMWLQSRHALNRTKQCSSTLGLKITC
jgi:hypothetical protein